MSTGALGTELAGARILVVEDEPAIADLLRRYLEREQAAVRLAADIGTARQVVQAWRPDAVLLDVGLPDGEGTALLAELRARQDPLAVLIVTARDDEVDRILGLERGADDYVTKPFSPREVVARVRAVLRRAARGAGSTPDHQLAMGRLRLDPGARRAFVGEQEVPLTPTEFDLLAHLMRRPGRVVGRTELLREVWGFAQPVGSRTVDVHVAQLRAKLGDACPVRTARGFGYAADPPQTHPDPH